MRYRNTHSLFFLISFLIIISCGQKKPDIKKEISILKNTGDTIQYDFTRILAATKNIAEFSQKLYTLKDNQVANSDTKLVLNENGVLFKPVNDSGSSVYVSGYFPVNNALKKIINITNPLDSFFKKIIKQFNPLIVQAYFLEKHSYIRLYPFIDVIGQFEPKLNFQNFNVYSLTNIEHNPGKNVVLISNPYVDPAGRGWVISSVAPVYFNDEQEGVVGVNITIDAMKKKYLSKKINDFILIDSTGVAMIIDEKKAGLLDITPLKTHKYLETIKRDEHLSEEYNLLKSKNKNIRCAIASLIRDNKDHTEVAIDDDKYFMISYKIPTLSWYLIKIIKEE